MGHELFIESLLTREARQLPAVFPCDGRRLLGALGGVIEFYFEQDAEARFTNVVYPFAADSWYVAETLRGHRWWEVEAWASPNFAVWAAYRKLFRQRQPIRALEFSQQLPAGELRRYRLDAHPDHDTVGNFRGYCGVVRDISDQRSSESCIATVEHAAIGIAHVDRSGRFVFTNRKLCEILGYSSSELLGMQVEQLSHADDQTLVARERHGRSEEGGACIRVEKRYRRKDGQVIWVRVTITEMGRRDEHGGFDISLMEDITERVKAEEDFRYLVTHDELTALPNRMLFTHLLRHAIDVARRHSRQMAVMLIDLDRFKGIVDSLGHAAGDFVLQEMSQRIRKSVRSSDLVARLGGDEFVVLLPEIENPGQAMRVASKLLENIVHPIALIEGETRLSASIGIALYPDNGDDDTSLLRRADQALYLAKGEGRNNFQFCIPEAEGAGVEKIRMETLLHRALDNDELTLHYQAKVEVGSGRVVGAEALLRWHSAQLGDVSPAVFVPLVEELELILPIGRWVIAEACAQLAAWRHQGMAIDSVAVNLSPRQFADPELINFIASMLAVHRLEGFRLELEITEGVVMHKPERALEILRAIKALGVRIAIDDFGTGYSSLGQLKRFPVDTLKIDRTFIKEIEHDDEDKALTRAIITMGKTLGLSVVAEGVETAGQAAFLAEHGCDLIQGYFYSKPDNPTDFCKLLH